MGKKKRATHPHPCDELRRVSGHLWYEIAMVRDLAEDARKSDVALHLSNARLEAFLIHARTLEWFFYADDGRKGPPLQCTDVIASDFSFRDGQSWTARRPEKVSDQLSKAVFRDRVNREIAHLTTERIEEAPEHKHWNVAGIEGALDNLWRQFSWHVCGYELEECWRDHPEPSIIARVDSEGSASNGSPNVTGPTYF